jgi:hypothetical protein
MYYHVQPQMEYFMKAFKKGLFPNVLSGMVVLACHPSTQEAEERGLGV